MLPNSKLMKATLTGALGGLLFGFDTVVISGAIDALVKDLYRTPPDIVAEARKAVESTR